MAKYRVSFLMSVYNGEKFIAETIESILNQSYKDFELIVIDDGSTDNSVQIIESFEDDRIKIFSKHNEGLAVSLNCGLRMATGDLIARIDSDDICKSNRLSIQLSCFEDDPDLVLCATGAEFIDEQGGFICRESVNIPAQEIMKLYPDFPIIHSSVMYKKKEIIELGGYDEYISKLNSFEDYFLWIKVFKAAYKMQIIPDELIQYRIVANASTTKIGRVPRIIAPILAKAVVRGYLIDEEIKQISAARKKLTYSERKSLYHAYLSKKYIKDNFQPRKAVANFIRAVFYSPLSIYNLYILYIIPYFIKHIFGSKIKNYSR